MKLFGRKKHNKLTEQEEIKDINNQDLTSAEEMMLNSMNRTQAGNLVAKMDKRKLDYKDHVECERYAQEACESIAMAQKQLVESKVEYGAVTSYLTDIQKIDQIALEEKEKLSNAARQILNLTEERNRIRNREIKISDFMYKHLEKYEDEIPDEIIKMQKNEEYEAIIKGDLQQLEGEKAVLAYEEDELSQKHKYIQKVTVVTILLVIALFVVFYMCETLFEVQIMIPFLITISVAAIGAYIIFSETMKNNRAIRINRQKMNRAIGLLNKVKIKYVNNRNNLDYTYQKYRVNASKELNYLWEQYVRVKDENRRYQKNTELLEYYNMVLMDELERFQVEDCEVWIHQPLALIDNKEMVEVRHRLNTRRQKLREQIDYNNTIVQNSYSELHAIAERKPELKEQIQLILYKNGLETKF